MSINPYESPAPAPEYRAAPPPNFNAAQRTETPGMILSILAGISLGMQAIEMMVRMALIIGGVELQVDRDAFFAVGVREFLVIGFLVLVANGMTLYGGMQMRKLESYSLSLAGAILAIVPCCSPCTIIGIPFGIWALIVLLDSQVKAAFRS